MYAQYTCLPLSDINNVYADVLAIITGTTDKMLLSSNCDKDNTVINSAVASGWVNCNTGLVVNSEITDLLPAGYHAAIGYGADTYVIMDGNAQSYAAGGCYSTNLINWTAHATPTGQRFWSKIVYGGGKFVAIAGLYGTSVTPAAGYSASGSAWSLGTGFPTANNYWGALAYGGTTPLFVAFIKGTASTVYATTLDSIAWTPQTFPASVGIADVVWSGSLFVALPGYNVSYQVVYTSSTGLSGWTPQPLPVNAAWQSICYGNGKFVAVSNTGHIIQSTDAASWNQKANFGVAFVKVLWCGSYFLAFTADSQPYYALSSDGDNWFLRQSALIGLYLTDAIWDGTQRKWSPCPTITITASWSNLARY